ncbi:MAG: phosphatidylglycerol lysyltransferase domain-containing protein [Alphaproteobacteria bacterium]|nr:phosphatidylglycerol lysyltransferase domain-containing protein [Alphaproteobacteria bacterium]
MTPTYKDIAYTDQENKAFALSDTSDQRAWESKFELISNVSRIPENDFTRLRQLLASCEDSDSYLTSPIYYSFTGRNGLWAYEKDGAFVLACWHPNIQGQILVFPQLVKSEVDLIGDLLSSIPEPPGGVRIARSKSAGVAELRDMYFDNRHVSLNKCKEDVLDWRYPVRILSTSHVAALSGHNFMRIRNHIRQLKRHFVETAPFDAISHSRALENLLHRWTNHNATSRSEYELLYAPYETLFSHGIDKSSGLSGQMIFVDGKLQAVGLWDVSNNHRKTANVYVNFCNTEIPGLSEFSMVQCCGTLHNQGIEYVNLGGSETENLDAYKRKFAPAITIDLCSVDVRINGGYRQFSKLANRSKSRKIISDEASNVERAGLQT